MVIGVRGCLAPLPCVGCCGPPYHTVCFPSSAHALLSTSSAYTHIHAPIPNTLGDLVSALRSPTSFSLPGFPFFCRSWVDHNLRIPAARRKTPLGRCATFAEGSRARNPSAPSSLSVPPSVPHFTRAPPPGSLQRTDVKADIGPRRRTQRVHNNNLPIPRSFPPPVPRIHHTQHKCDLHLLCITPCHHPSPPVSCRTSGNITSACHCMSPPAAMRRTFL